VIKGRWSFFLPLNPIILQTHLPINEIVKYHVALILQTMCLYIDTLRYESTENCWSRCPILAPNRPRLTWREARQIRSLLRRPSRLIWPVDCHQLLSLARTWVFLTSLHLWKKNKRFRCRSHQNKSSTSAC